MKSALLFLLVAPIAAAQAPLRNPAVGPDCPPPMVVEGTRERQIPRDFGVGVAETYEVFGGAMVPYVSDTAFDLTGPGRYLTGGTGHWFIAPLTLPSGVLVTAIEVDACDTNPSQEVELFLNKCPPHEAGCTPIASVATGVAATPGCQFFTIGVPGGGETLDQTSYAYHLLVYLSATGTSLSFDVVRAYWQRQISPAPATATFADVPTTHPFFRVIEALAASGITTGCGGGNFCPDGVVTRQEVAKFLARALGLSYSY
jgi:hypothetical protein